MISIDTIKSRAPLRDYLAKIGSQPQSRNDGTGWASFSPHPYRVDSNSGAFKANCEAWVDHVTGDKGSVIDLVMKRRDVDIKGACEELADLFGITDHAPAMESKPKPKAKPKTLGAEVCRYNYDDLHGATRYQVVRFKPKTFRQVRMEAGRAVWNLSGVTRILYRLPEVMRAQEVWIVEGEKDADTLHALGACATTNVGGAGNWLEAYADVLTGKDVIYCGDQDEAGEKHREAVLASLEGKVKTLRVVNVPAKDVTELVRQTGVDLDAAKTKLGILVESAPIMPKGYTMHSEGMAESVNRIVSYWMGPGKKEIFSMGDWLPSFKDLRPVRPGDLIVIMGYTGSCKTFVAQHLVNNCGCPVAFFQQELARELFTERQIGIRNGMKADSVHEMLKVGNCSSLLMQDNMRADFRAGLTVDQMSHATRRDALVFGEPVGLAVVDYIQLCKGEGKTKYEKMSNVAESLKVMAKNTNTAVVIISQVKRPEAGKFKRLTLFDAKETGSIENSASMVLALDMEDGESNTRWLRILKSTTGGTGTARLEIDWATSALRDTGRSDKSTDWASIK